MTLFTINSSAFTLCLNNCLFPQESSHFRHFLRFLSLLDSQSRLFSSIFFFSFWQLVVPLNPRKSWQRVLFLRFMEKVEGVSVSFLQFHKRIYGHSYSLSHDLLLNYYSSNIKMHKILLTLQCYRETPTQTYFGHFWSTIMEHPIVRNSV
jgi:hypothetical protein